MAELSLSNALLDGIILTHTIHPDDEDYDNHEPTEPEYPALVYSDPYKALSTDCLLTNYFHYKNNLKGDII